MLVLIHNNCLLWMDSIYTSEQCNDFITLVWKSDIHHKQMFMNEYALMCLRLLIECTHVAVAIPLAHLTLLVTLVQGLNITYMYHS